MRPPIISYILLGLLITGCSPSNDTSDDRIRIMPLGNSITYGNYHPEYRPEELITGYRQALWLMLRDAGYEVDFVGSRTTGADAEPDFDPNNEGYPGWTDDQIKDNVYKWLKKNPPDIIMLHIGTNGLDPDPSDVEGILDEIDRFEKKSGHPIKVIMAKIINRSTYSQLTTEFNQNIEKMALDRVFNDGDDIVVIDMEFETEIDYRLSTSGGEMFDNLHPYVGGHEKMAVRWFEALIDVLSHPSGPDKKENPLTGVTVRERDTRMREGLLALYEYTEQEGNLVHDMSGVGLPYDIYINNEGNVIWDPVQGLEITRETILVPSDMNRKVVDSVIASNAISLEAWIRTGNIEQDGPAHIISISDPLGTGVTLSQEFEYKDTARFFYSRNLHTSTSDTDGSPALKSGQMYNRIALQHLVYTKDANGNESFYINGVQTASGKRKGDFSSWNEHTFKLSLGNSLGFDNRWTGKLFLTALYNVALSQQQVQQNFNAGFGSEPLRPELPDIPGKLESTALSAIAIRLTWTDRSDNETGFVVERKEVNGVFHYVASVSSGVTELVDAGLVANTGYTYRITALNDYGGSDPSIETTVKTFSDDALTNVALGKLATQSSTTFEGDPSRAVDGNTDGSYANGSVSHTAYELNAWWEVDLEEVFNIDHIEIWNRTDKCCKDRMARFFLFISEEPFNSFELQATLNQEGVHAIYQAFYPEPMIALNVAKKGRYIRVQQSDSQNINIAELVVMGNTLNDPPGFITRPEYEDPDPVR